MRLRHFTKPIKNDSKPRVLILTTACGSEGLTLIGADRVIIADLGLSPSEDSQAIGRVHRIGQLRDVIAYRLVSVVEEHQYARIVKKTSNTSLISRQSNFVDEEEIDRIFVNREDFDSLLFKDRFLSRMPKEFDNDVEAQRLKALGTMGVHRHDLLLKAEEVEQQDQLEVAVVDGHMTPVQRIPETVCERGTRSVVVPRSTLKLETRLQELTLDQGIAFPSDDEEEDDDDENEYGDLDGFVVQNDEVTYMDSDEETGWVGRCVIDNKPTRLIKLDLFESDIEDECDEGSVELHSDSDKGSKVSIIDSDDD
ncbi:hypothetical protein GEMRC1_001914 [Eukaryota sp. GEM-RC1]